MSAQEVNFDLDFTKCFLAVRPVAPNAALIPTAAPRAPVESAVAPRAGTLVCYARPNAARSAAAADAPVLVVEDHEASRRVLEKMLLLQGFPVRMAADNREFARELRKPPFPRLILLDVGLPRVDGFQILTHLRLHPQTSQIPVVLVTARTDERDIRRGLSLGVDGYLSKPISVKALKSVMDTVLWKP